MISKVIKELQLLKVGLQFQLSHNVAVLARLLLL